MIYEVRTYQVKPRSLPEVLKRFGEAYEKRKALSQLYAFWYTEIGALNQIVHVWPYKDLEERNRIRAEAIQAGIWPPKMAEFITSMRTDIMIPWGDVPPIQPGKVGPYFEMRTYTYAAGDLPKIQANWTKALARRYEFSPLLALWYCEIGDLNTFVHIWPYQSLDQRMDVRRRATASGHWPPPRGEGDGSYTLLQQETKILLAAPFSPLQ